MSFQHPADRYDRARTGISEAWRLYALFCMQDPAHAVIKIGVSSTIYQRLLTLQTGLPFPMGVCLHTKIGERGRAMHLEASLHRAFAERNTRGEWFAFDLSSKADKWVFHDTVQRMYDRMFGDNFTWERIFPQQLEEYASLKHIEAKERGLRRAKREERHRRSWEHRRGTA